ncbi:hypothetical protein ABPG75_011178 [Micractinium tetrahymenae]
MSAPCSQVGTSFTQDPPHLGNQFSDDGFLQSLLGRLLPPEALPEVQQDLERFGWEAATSIKQLGQQAEAQPPRLVQHDAWGGRIDAVVTSPAWQALKAVSAREGLVAAAYERRQGQHSRIAQMAKLYLFGASSGLYNCPLAMTDGAARLCEMLLAAGQGAPASRGGGRPASEGQQAGGELQAALAEAFCHLTSRNPAEFRTSGQWMTEKRGGSDVSYATETVAEPEQAGQTGVGSWYRLYGYKWFTSAADGEAAMALARELPAGQAGAGHSGGSGSSSTAGSGAASGLALFYVPVRRDAAGRPQGFEVVRLKDKLGTRQLPTAELLLTGIRALKISEAGRGVPAIAPMVNITRLHNAAAAASYMRRITALAQDYARRRSAFGAPLINQPLAQRALAWLHLHTAGSLALTLEVARLLVLQECGCAAPEEAHLLRLLTPLAKLYTAKESVAVVSEGIEFSGGQGYIEGTHLPVILRDAQVLPIWEGSTSVLVLDVLRVLSSAPQAAAAFTHCCSAELNAAAAAAAALGGDSSSAGQALGRACTALRSALPGVEASLRAAVAAGPGSAMVQVGSRDLAFAMARLFVGVLLAAHAAWSGEEEHALLAAEWACECGASSGSASSTAEAVASSAAERPEAQLHIAAVLSGADRQLSEPRARY